MTTFVTVIPQLRTIRGQDRFTYLADTPVQVGEVVRIPWRRQVKHGIVVDVHAAAHPQAKAILATTGIILPTRYLDFLLWLAERYRISEPAAVLAALPDDPSH